MKYKTQESTQEDKYAALRTCFSDKEILRIRIQNNIEDEIYMYFSEQTNNQIKIEFSDYWKNGACTFNSKKRRGAYPNVTRAASGDLNLPNETSETIDVPLVLQDNYTIIELPIKKEGYSDPIDKYLSIREQIEDTNEEIENLPELTVWFDKDERKICFSVPTVISNTDKEPPHA